MFSSGEYHFGSVALRAGRSNTVLSYGDLESWVLLNRSLLRTLSPPIVVFQFCPTSLGAIASYIACLQERIPLALCDSDVQHREKLLTAYAPNALILPTSMPAPLDYTFVGILAGGFSALWQRSKGYQVTPNPQLALLLATSGSTGDPKFVRLSLANLESNARSISEYLGIHADDVALQTLPMHYSYGLSVINSHLIAGATVVLPESSFVSPQFWTVARDCQCTSFAGVPYMYETLFKLGVVPTKQSTIRTMTQAGGALKSDLVKHFHHSAEKNRSRFIVMYGQTEATARISYVPATRLIEKSDSVGIPIPRGKMWLEPTADGAKQLFYSGPNVMLGYASTPSDFALGDQLGGVLATGDLAEVDSEGFFKITGRLNRFAKILGKRINLANVEADASRFCAGRIAAMECSDAIKLVVESSVDIEAMRTYVSRMLALPRSLISIKSVDSLPTTSSGKINYHLLP